MKIQLSGIFVSAGGNNILSGVDAVFESGKLVALAGPSGSGKTTLLNVVGLLTSINAGKVTLDGEDATRWSDSRRVKFWRKKAAFIFQDYGLVEDESALYNVGLATLSYYGIARRSRGRIFDALETVGLKNRELEKVSALSGGEKQRVGLARAIFRRADVVLADEPTASLDRANREMVTSFLREEAKRGALVLVATHDEELLAHCDEVVRLGN